MATTKNVYEMVTNRIIEQLEQGVIPWQKPWSGVRSGAYNRISKKAYSLLNQMCLKHDGEYATYTQWQAVGGQVRKGEKAEFVTFWKMIETEEQNEDGETVTNVIPYLRYYPVFHISQVDGVEPLEKPELTEIEADEHAEQILMDYITREGIHFEQMVSNDAYYAPFSDTIHLPLKEQFKEIGEYYSVAFHESTHSTMKSTRCNRPQKLAAFGNEDYSKEELVAEIGSATILNMIGLETDRTFQNSTSYIASWLKVLKSDNRFIVSASSKAEKAVKYIMGIEA